MSAHLERQRDELLRALKCIVDRDLSYFSGFVLDGLIPAQDIQRAREVVLAIGRNSSEAPNGSDALASQAEEIERLTAERDAAFKMSRCECATDEACANLARLHAEIATLRARLAELEAQEPVAKLHDDGYWTFADGVSLDLKHKSQFAGWRLDVYARPMPAEKAGMVKAPAVCSKCCLRHNAPTTGWLMGKCRQCGGDLVPAEKKENEE